MDFHRRCKQINDEWWWVSILKNASTTMEGITTEGTPMAGAKYLAIIRDPFDRLVSCWENKGDAFKQDSFADFIKHVYRTQDGYVNAHAQSQISFIDRPIDKYILFDSLQEDFKHIGIEIPDHKNKSVRRQEDYWTPELRRMVAARYPEDLKLYQQVSTLPRRGYNEKREHYRHTQEGVRDSGQG